MYRKIGDKKMEKKWKKKEKKGYEIERILKR